MTEVEKLRKALQFIIEWDLPKVIYQGAYVSYGYANGSDGERDFIRNIAKAALQEPEVIPSLPPSRRNLDHMP